METESRTSCTLSSEPASTMIVASFAEPWIMYTPAAVIVMSFPSERVIVSAADVSAICSRSRLVKRSVASIAPLELTFAVEDAAESFPEELLSDSILDDPAPADVRAVVWVSIFLDEQAARGRTMKAAITIPSIFDFIQDILLLLFVTLLRRKFELKVLNI